MRSRRNLTCLLMAVSFFLALAVFLLPGLPLFGDKFPRVQRAWEDSGQLKSIGEFRKDVRAFVQRSKNSSDSAQRYGAVVDLCWLHAEIVADQRYESNERLRSFRAIVASRLKKCQREIELALKRDDRRRSESPKRTDGRVFGKSNHVFDDDGFQWQGEWRRWANDDLRCLTSCSGGPIRLWNFTSGGRFAGPLGDYGPDLVRLIENTIDPSSWRRNGGNGVIHYYQPLSVLVVNASAQTQRELSSLLQSLRSNGR